MILSPVLARRRRSSRAAYGAQTGRQANTDGRTFYPAESLTWIQENEPDANVFTTHMWGGYFINGLDPEGHVYIDGRSTMYGPDRFVSYRLILNANAARTFLENQPALAVPALLAGLEAELRRLRLGPAGH